MNAQVIAVVNQKGGTGKSTTCANLGIGLAQAGKKVLVVDVDPQASLSISLGHSQPDDLPVTLSDLMGKVLNDQPIAPGEGILHHAEGVDLMPSNIQLSGMEVSLVNAMSRETILRQYLDTVKRQYTHNLISGHDTPYSYDELHGTRMFSEKEFARFMDLQLEGTKQPRDHTRGTFSQPETRKRVEKKSVLAKLSVPLPRREHKKSAPKKSAERDR